MFILEKLAAILGILISKSIPAFFDEWRKARKVVQVGGGQDIKDDITKSIDEELKI